ncbi:MAG: hypothetical protein H0V89_14015 [Deltaproteobacteria bacterium]|nr:hypothetical protein [Deltaproteobacteria bacterium]
MTKRWTLALLVIGGCASAAEREARRSVLLTVENRAGAGLYFFQHAPCGSDDWTDVIASDEFLPDGEDLSTGNLEPGCYDLYVEDEFACSAENTSGEREEGTAFIWTVEETDLVCD